MSSDASPKSSRQKVQEYRARKRAQGYRLMQRWVLDTETEEFKERARRASLAIANSPFEAEDQDFVDSISILNDL